MKRILFVTSEAHPLIKTGGLADVSSSLPKALADLGQDIRIIIPNYQAIKKTENVQHRCTLRINNCDVNILETRLPESKVIVWLIDCPQFFDYPGNPYHDEYGNAWANSADRFSLFCRITVEVAMNRAYLDWKPEIVHCNDWQSGLVPALLTLEYNRPATIFTIHNMAYQGIFPHSTYHALNLPRQLWNPNALEYYGNMSFLKGGIACSDRVTTVSPTYAKEIQSSEFGYGLEGLLTHRKEFLSGILNGTDNDWNPEFDSNIVQRYSHKTLHHKQTNKAALQERLSLPLEPSIPIFGLISRLVEQKGIDLLLECLPELLSMPVQFVLLGSGNKSFEQRLYNFAEAYPEKMSITIGYDEQLAHWIEAGSDIFLMPSRFEPCGLNQMYSQRYGTLPIVRKTGGLADTVVDALPHTIDNKTATGITFNESTPSSLLEAIKRALILYRVPEIWTQLQTNAMRKDFSWNSSAKQYLSLYDHL
ncbi:glycogen synthase GlgA [Methylotuvimicrobium sp. KM1]|uniref:glycogen synthase GlgA n=1 Tax=Methylotuvimicrobium sp. KM1 TaxID=3377707 RepID=UPI00384E7F21